MGDRTVRIVRAPGSAKTAPKSRDNRFSKRGAPPASSKPKDKSFLLSAADAAQFPAEQLQGESPLEVAFLGRSNVGKSSLLNTLVKQPGLAFTSARPGCTQLINFYRIDAGTRFVDLPGYGYARVSLEERASWKKLIESYLVGRQSLALSFLLVDARRGWMEMDLELKAWLEFHNRRYQVIVTKIDKLKSSNEIKSGLAAIQKELPNQELVPFSALDGRGVREIWQVISSIKKKS
jgi:GTP-binding protein